MGGRDPLAGERHPGAILSDRDCELILALRDEGMSLRELGVKFEVSKGCIAKLASGQRRSLVVTGESGLHPKRRCARQLPTLPTRNAGEVDGHRALVLMVLALTSKC